MSELRSTDLYDLLQEVRKRPGMYIHQKSLDELHTMCGGYSIALHSHGIEEFGLNFNGRFSDWLYVENHWSGSSGWAHQIGSRFKDREMAFEKFFELLEAFRAGEQNDSKQGEV